MSENDSQENLEEAAAESLKRIVDSLVVLLKLTGISEERFRDYVAESYRSVEVPLDSPKQVASVTPEQRTFYGSILSTWRSDPVFLDEMGQAKALPMWGDGASLEEVFNKTLRAYPAAYHDVQFEEAMSALREAGTLIEKDGLYEAKGHFNVNTASATSAVLQLAYAADYVETCETNALNTDRKKRLFQRLVSGVEFPESELPKVKALLTESGMDLLQQLDDLLENPKVDDLDAVEKALVNVGIFLSVRKTDRSGR